VVVALSTVPRDRRHLRRAETIEQIVDVAVEVMGESGVAGLSLGEVARRMGIRPPSLYVYFASKHAVYDAVFARGWREVDAVLAATGPPPEHGDLAAYVLELASAFARWNVEHPVHAQLMAWRPVPGYEPSPEAYAPAVACLQRAQETISVLQERGLLRADVPPEQLLRTWTVLVSGVMTQQLANAPGQPFATGTYTALLPELVAMFLSHHAPATTPSQAPRRRRADRDDHHHR
jgi:AcrR family transcriptional regulator